MQERLAIVVLLLAVFSNCDLKTDQPGTKIDKNGNIWLDYGDAPDAQNTVADNEDFEVMLDPEADYKYFEHHGDYTLIKPKFWRRFRNGGRPRRLINVLFSRWENGVIPYSISLVFNEVEVNQIIKAMAHWEESTCIRFKKRTTESDYVDIFRGVGCYSFIGRVGGPQGLSLGSNCLRTQRTVLHELGHSIGFFHEQNRKDRDENVNVLYDNIEYGVPHEEFEAFTSIYFENQGLTYDYNSIMHYDGYQSSSNGNPTIEAHDKDIPVGLSVTLTELDIIRTNLYYSCPEIPPQRSTIYANVAKHENVPSRPFECGRFISGELNGTITTPSYPRYQSEQKCSWQILVPRGYRIQLFINSFGLKETLRTCPEGNITLYANLSSAVRVLDTGCPRLLYSRYITRLNEAHIQYRSGSNTSDNPAMGFSLSFTADDINECEEIRPCSHQCINTPGGYSCLCPKGFFLSADSHNCFDINECAPYGELCEYKCRNFAGHYKCICRDGTIQGLTCNSTIAFIPENPTPGTIIPKHQPSLVPATGTPPVSTPTPPMCGGQLTDSSGFFNTPNWPLTYPSNFNCMWNIVLNDTNAIIEIIFDDDFGIGGQMPECPKDRLILFDGGSSLSQQLGLFCHLTRPDPIRTTSNRLTVLFVSTSSHGPTRHGFRAQYRAIITAPSTTTSPPATTAAPTITLPPATTSAPATTSPPATTSAPTITLPSATTSAPATTSPSATPAATILPMCGGKLTDSSGLLNTPNWPLTYPFDFNCVWNIVLNDPNAIIEIRFDDDFGIAGQMPECSKDQLILFDGGSSQSQQLGLFCHLTRPDPIRTTSNRLTVLFVSLSSHGPTRHGFRAQYVSITLTPSTTTSPPTTTSAPTISLPPTTTSAPATTSPTATIPPMCGGKLTDSSGLLNTPNWPLTYPFDFNCVWNIVLNDSNAIIEIRFDDDFGIGGQMPECPKDRLILFDGGSSLSQQLGLFCHLTRPDPIRTTSNRLTVLFVSLSSHGPTRHGFRAQYRAITGATSTTTLPPATTSAPTISSPPATTSAPTISSPPATTSAPTITLPPATPAATILPMCGGKLTDSSGLLNTPNWPLTYPFDFNCVWNIVLNDPNAIIEIRFDDDFGIGGQMPECPKDRLILFDGGSSQSQQLGLFCHLTRPDPIRTTSNRLTVLFVSMSSHGPTRHGFRAQYISITLTPSTTTSPPTTTSAPTTTSPPATTSSPATTLPPATIAASITTSPPATTTAVPITTSSPATTSAPTLQLPQCGGGLHKRTSLSGSLQTFDWPNSPYALNTMCDWDIECPLGTMINILFEDSFRVAGSMPNCIKDKLKISGCGGMNYGPYCHLTPPDAFSTTCNAVHVSFQAGSDRGMTRTGFKLNYVCTELVVPTLTPQCGGGEMSLTAPSGSIQTLNWPDNPYPINTECSWDISCLLGVEINFEANFRVAGRMPECTKDQLKISGCSSDYGPYCHLTPPNKIRMTCKKVNVLFRSRSSRGVSRIGFKLNYRCL